MRRAWARPRRHAPAGACQIPKLEDFSRIKPDGNVPVTISPVFVNQVPGDSPASGNFDNEEGFLAYAIGLDGCVVEGRTEEETLANIKEAIAAWRPAAAELETAA